MPQRGRGDLRRLPRRRDGSRPGRRQLIHSGHHKKKTAKKGPQPLKPLYHPNDQKVVVQIHPDTPPQSSIQMTWQYLQMANCAIREYQKDLDYCFIRCHVTMKQNLVLQTSTKTQGPDYLPYLDAVKAKLEEEGKLRATAIDGEPLAWSSDHGVNGGSCVVDSAILPWRPETRPDPAVAYHRVQTLGLDPRHEYSGPRCSRPPHPPVPRLPIPVRL